MNDEIISACYRFAGGFLVGTIIGISWVDFHYPHASLPEAWIHILFIGSLTGIGLAILPKFIREGFWLSIWPALMPFRLYLLILVVLPLILMFLPYRKGGLVDRILENHWWNWF